jgi:hypothetical protein
MDEQDWLMERAEAARTKAATAAKEARDYQVFTFTTTELALLLWAFSSHMNDIAKLPPVAWSEHEPPSCPENDAIHQVLEKLAASVAEGMTMEDAAWACFPKITPSSTPPGEVAAWWRAGIARTSAWWSSEIYTAMRSLCRSRTPKPKAQGSTNNAPPTHSRVNARPEKRTMHNQYPPTSYPSYTLSLNRPSLARRGVRALPFVALLLFIIGSVGFAQSQTSPATAAKTQVVEIKDDRFTNTRTVTLSKLRITDDLLLSLKAEVKPSELHGINRELEESPYVYVTFEEAPLGPSLLP